MLILLPCIFLFSTGCDGNNNDSEGTSDIICTVIFYTGITNEFNVPMQEVMQGGKVKRPINFPTRYLDEQTRKTYQLVGWYSDQSLNEESLWKFETDTVRSNMTLYAKWQDLTEVNN
jgi:uncharacterized repeat protein (TIGR02543 family)